MIGVGRVLELNLPVSREGEAMLPSCFDRETPCLFHEQVNPWASAPEKVFERRGALVEGCKDQAAVALDPELDEAVIAFIKILVTLWQRHTSQTAVLRVSPCMIGTNKPCRVSRHRLAHRCGAVAAAIEHDTHDTFFVAIDDHRLASDVGSYEIAWIGQLAVMGNPDPGF